MCLLVGLGLLDVLGFDLFEDVGFKGLNLGLRDSVLVCSKLSLSLSLFAHFRCTSVLHFNSCSLHNVCKSRHTISYNNVYACSSYMMGEIILGAMTRGRVAEIDVTETSRKQPVELSNC